MQTPLKLARPVRELSARRVAPLSYRRANNIICRAHAERSVALPASGAPGDQHSDFEWLGHISARAAVTAAAAMALSGAVFVTDAPEAGAFGPVKIPLDEFRLDTVPCPQGTRSFGGYSKSVCLIVTARAQSPSKDTLFNVDVFGRVYDAQGANALDRDEASDAGRVTNIPKVEPGETLVQFPLRVAEVQARLGDLQLKNFKAVGYPGAAWSPLLNECDDDEMGELQLGGSCVSSEDQVP